MKERVELVFKSIIDKGIKDDATIWIPHPDVVAEVGLPDSGAHRYADAVSAFVSYLSEKEPPKKAKPKKKETKPTTD